MWCEGVVWCEEILCGVRGMCSVRGMLCSVRKMLCGVRGRGLVLVRNFNSSVFASSPSVSVSHWGCEKLANHIVGLCFSAHQTCIVFSFISQACLIWCV